MATRPGHRPSTTCSDEASPGTTSAIVETNCAVRCGSRMSDSWSRRSSRLAVASFACPAQYAEKTPGAPPSTSTQMPESSASAGSPVWAAAARALMSAFSAKVTPSSTGSGPS